MREILSPLDGFGSPFGQGARASGFDPASLFAAGEEGFFHAINPATCFADTAGTTPATISGAVARVTDLSGNGHHLVQTTAASRPIFGRHPVGGVRNILRGNYFASGGSALTRDYGDPPAGYTGRSILVTDNSTVNPALVFRTSPVFDITTGDKILFATMVRAGTSPKTTVNGYPAGQPEMNITITWTGGVPTIDATGFPNGVVPMGDGWYIIWYVYTAVATVTTNLLMRVWSHDRNDGQTPIGDTVEVFGFSAELTDTFTALQDVSEDGFDVTEPGAQYAYYLETDGIDDSMVTTSALALASVDIILGAHVSAGITYCLASNSILKKSFVMIGTDLSSAESFSQSGAVTTRVDGAIIGGTRGDLYAAATGGAHVVEARCSTTLWPDPIRLFAYSQDAAFFTAGRLYSVIMRAAMTTEELTLARAHVAAKSGVTLP